MLKSGAVLNCSFCGKTQEQVVKLIAGPGVYICDECIALCNEIIAEEAGERTEGLVDAEVEAAARAATDAVNRLRRLAQKAQSASKIVH